MDAATAIWTLILFGGTVAVVIWLVIVAWRKQEEHVDGESTPDQP